MKYVKVLIPILILAFTFLGCSSKNELYGEYEFDELVFLSPLSSASADYLTELMEGTQYKFEKDSFQIITSDHTYEVKDPIYTRIKMDEELVKAFEDSTFSMMSIDEYKDKYQYFISSEGNDKVNYYLYSMDGELWIASYVDNTASGLSILMNIVKLK